MDRRAGIRVVSKGRSATPRDFKTKKSKTVANMNGVDVSLMFWVSSTQVGCSGFSGISSFLVDTSCGLNYFIEPIWELSGCKRTNRPSASLFSTCPYMLM